MDLSQATPIWAIPTFVWAVSDSRRTWNPSYVPRSVSLVAPKLTYRGSQQLMDEWLPISGGSVSIHVQVAFKPNQNQHLTIDSFELLKVIGKGSFGKVSTELPPSSIPH